MPLLLLLLKSGHLLKEGSEGFIISIHKTCDQQKGVEWCEYRKSQAKPANS